jgi:hypothetical protein
MRFPSGEVKTVKKYNDNAVPSVVSTIDPFLPSKESEMYIPKREPGIPHRETIMYLKKTSADEDPDPVSRKTGRYALNIVYPKAIQTHIRIIKQDVFAVFGSSKNK